MFPLILAVLNRDCSIVGLLCWATKKPQTLKEAYFLFFGGWGVLKQIVVYTLHPKNPYNLNPKPQTLTPKPQTLNPKP